MIALIVVSSAEWGQKEVGERVKDEVSALLHDLEGLTISGPIYDIESAQDISKKLEDTISGCVLLVATGGTEKIAWTISKTIDVPMLLWASPSNNSLASSLELFAALKDFPIKLLYSPLSPSSIKEIRSFSIISETIMEMKKSRIGVVGGVSDWILTSSGEELKRFGPELVVIDTLDLLDEMKMVDELEAKTVFRQLKDGFGRIEVSEKEMIEAVRVYLAMRKLVSKRNLSAITIRCFDLLKNDCTACIGMGLCNDDLIPAGCEGDLQAILTMVVVSSLASEPCWMANVARIDKNRITLAHCTISTRMISDLAGATLVHHMESGKGVAIRGPMKEGEVTLARIGRNLDKMSLAKGRIVKTDMRDPDLCRTQVEIELEGNAQDYLTNALGNHQIIVYGDLTEGLADFSRFKGIEAIIFQKSGWVGLKPGAVKI